MLQDLLLALYGIPGGLFVETSPSTDQQSNFLVETELAPVSTDLPLVPPGELSLYTDLLKLGSCYHHLETFIRRRRLSHYSLYLSAFACGLDDALMNYRETIVKLESDLLADPDLNVAHLTYHLHTFKLILPFLADLAHKVDNLNENARSSQLKLGCMLLDTLVLSAPVGLTGPRLAVRLLIARGMRIFCRQIHSWLIFGRLHDPHNEFFVQSGAISPETKSHDNASTSFLLCVDRIPSFLPASFAQHVFSVGQLVNQITRDESHPDFLTELNRQFGPRFTSLSRSWELLPNATEDVEQTGVENLIDTNPLLSLVSEIRLFVSSRVLQIMMQEHGLVKYLGDIKHVLLLGRGELFLAFVDQLNSLNEFDAFSGDASQKGKVPFHRSILDRPPPNTEAEVRALEYVVQVAFLAAVRAIGLDDDELDSKFRFTISLDPVDSEGIPPEHQTVWDRLHLQVLVPPALKMVFSKHVCRGYDRMFRYLATIRRTQLALQLYWGEQTARWRCICAPQLFHRTPLRQDPAGDRPSGSVALQQSTIDRCLLVRNAMAFFVDSLQCFLQVDVIDAQFAHLINRVESDQDIDLVLAAHEAFLDGLQAQALLFHPTAKPCIIQLLPVCRGFVKSASIATAKASTAFESELSQTEERLIQDFHQVSSTLFQCLSSSESVGAKSSVGFDVESSKRYTQTPGPRADLSQLLLRLDFNHFYSNFQSWYHRGSRSDGTVVI